MAAERNVVETASSISFGTSGEIWRIVHQSRPACHLALACRAGPNLPQNRFRLHC
jgi:hypothetical protein